MRTPPWLKLAPASRFSQLLRHDSSLSDFQGSNGEGKPWTRSRSERAKPSRPQGLGGCCWEIFVFQGFLLRNGVLFLGICWEDYWQMWRTCNIEYFFLDMKLCPFLFGILGVPSKSSTGFICSSSCYWGTLEVCWSIEKAFYPSWPSCL